MRLTADAIARAPVFINPLKDREIDLRGNKFPTIENLGATQDQFDTIDLSDNEISRLDNIPLMEKLRTLLISNNKICKISTSLSSSLPHLETLVLSNNRIASFTEVDHLSHIKTLRVLSLLENPVSKKVHYRPYVVFKMPHLTLLDFRKVKLRDRQEAKKLFGTPKESAAKTFEPNEPEEEKMSVEDRERIKKAITEAKSMEEVAKLEAILASGRLPPTENKENENTEHEADGQPDDNQMEE